MFNYLIEEENLSIENERLRSEKENQVEAELRNADVMIYKNIGMRVEAQDGIIKIWKKSIEIPDETNWSVAKRFSNTASLCDKIFLFLGFSVEIAELVSDGVTEYTARAFKEGFETTSCRFDTKSRAMTMALLEASSCRC